MVQTQNIQPQLNKITNYLEKKPEVLSVYLYGSYAKGYANDKSDIDIGVLLEPTFKPDLFFLGNLYEEVNNLVDDYKVETYILNEKSPMFRYKAISPRKILFSRNNDLRADFEVKTMNEYLEYRPFYEEYHKNMVEKVKRRVFSGQG